MSRPLLPNPFSNDRLSTADAFNEALDVPSLHEQASAWLEQAIDVAAHRERPDGDAKIAVLQATPGFGKTHVMGRVAHRCTKLAIFAHVPQMDAHGSPVRHIHWHILRTFFDAPPGQRPLLHRVLAQLCHQSFREFFNSLPHTVRERHQSLRERLYETSAAVQEIVAANKEPGPYLALGNSIATRLQIQPVALMRALALGWSPRSPEAWRWLRGEQLEQSQLAELKLPEDSPTPTQVLLALARVLQQMQLALVVCCDQSEGFLRKPSATEELTDSLMGWVDSVPNLVLALTFLKDSWLNFSGGRYQSFTDRSKALDLAPLKGPQAVELLRKRLAGWPGSRADKGPVWPFRENDVLKFTAEKPLDPRGLLQKCAAALDVWLAKKSDQELGIGGDDGKKPIEELFQQAWSQCLEGVRKEQVAPENLQEERLFRGVQETLELARVGRLSVGGLEVLQLQERALAKYLSVQIKLGVENSAAAVPVVVAVSKLTGGNAATGFISALETAVADPVAGAVLVRPSAQLTLGARTKGRIAYDSLKARGKLRPYELTEHRAAFEQMECFVRLLERAEQKDLQLGQQNVSRELCQELAARTQVLANLDLLERIFCGWPQAAAVPASSSLRAREVAAAVVAKPAVAAVSTSAAPKSPPARLTTETVTTVTIESWADKLLQAVAGKLAEFGQKVEPLGVEIGPTFARLRLKPLGRTSIGRVRNHANDLRAHIPGIRTVPVIADQPGYISVDVQRPDPQPVPLKNLLRKASAAHEGQPVFPVGADVTGEPHWLNLADPSTCHVLAAGTTGSGKSEFLKAMLAGLAARLSPLELQLVLVDPKHVTFNFPRRSPYLLHPVAHTVDEAMPLVQECFAETERRYALLERRGLEHVGQLTGNEALPRVVVIFDEFADLMAESETRKALEGALKRIGALARAAGIHLVLATQRPDKDVVTPLLKANLPTRVCLRVESERNSKIILDEEGGENLLGRGDLFWKYGGGMVRLQGAFVGKTELESLLRVSP